MPTTVTTVIKPISSLTNSDKVRFLSYFKSIALQDTGVPWLVIETGLIRQINEFFDDAIFSKLPSEEAIKAAYARDYFKWTEKHKRPSLVDFLLWQLSFDLGSDKVEIPAPSATANTSEELSAASTALTESFVSAAKAMLPKNKAKSEKKLQSEKKIRQNSPWAEIAKLEDLLFTATQVIKTYPTSFLTHPDFMELIELGQKQIADEEKYPFRLTASLPVMDLRKTIYGTVNVNDKNVDDSKLKRNLTLTEKRKAEAKLRLLPLPVTIERHPEITGTNEEIMVFNWFRCAGPEQAKEVVNLIPKFFLLPSRLNS